MLEAYQLAGDEARTRLGQLVEYPLGLKSVRENWCRPYGTRSLFPLAPGTSVPGFHMPPLRGWNPVSLSHLCAHNSVLTHTLKPELVWLLYAALKRRSSTVLHAAHPPA